ncbi:MAG: FHA domain-containing protein [Ardenticatenaceae bacterium]|nr:FHA domain-containing protein [Ardenticatenaceae bacterium]
MTKPPQTLAQFLALLGRGFLKGLPWKLALAGGIALATWIIHTYLLVGPNGGFAPGTNPFLDQVLALSDRVRSGTLFWLLLSSLATLLIMRLVRFGVRPTLRQVGQTPGWLRHSARQAGSLAWPLLLLGGMAIALLLGTFLTSRVVSLQLAIAGLGALVIRQSGALFMGLHLGWRDVQRWTRRAQPTSLNLAWAGLATLGATLGFLAASGLPFPPYGGCVGVVLLGLAMAAVIAWVKTRPGSGQLLLWLLINAGVALLLALVTRPVWADDGGWQEAGGTLSGWLQSPGAARAIAMGVLPAMGAAGGVLLGLFSGGLPRSLAESDWLAADSSDTLQPVPAPAGTPPAPPESTAPPPPPPQPAKADATPHAPRPGQAPKPGEPAAKPAATAKPAPPEAVKPAATLRETTPGQAPKPGEPAAKAVAAEKPAPPEAVKPAATVRETPPGQAPKLDDPAAKAVAADKPAPPEAVKPAATVRETPPGQVPKLDEPAAKAVAAEKPAPPEAVKPAATLRETPPEAKSASSPHPAGDVPGLAITQPLLPPAGIAAGAAVVIGAAGLAAGGDVTPVSQPHWQLVVVQGPGRGTAYPLGGQMVLGRGSEADVILADGKVSRRHALIEQQGGTFRLSDLDSTNGTAVNGQRLSAPVLLRPGDTIQLGDVVLQVEAL